MCEAAHSWQNQPFGGPKSRRVFDTVRGRRHESSDPLASGDQTNVAAVPPGAHWLCLVSAHVMCIKLNLQERVKAFHIEARARCLQGARVNIWKSAFTPAALYVFRRGALCSEWTGFPLQWNLPIDETSLNVALKFHFLSGYDKRRSSFLQRVGFQSPRKPLRPFLVEARCFWVSTQNKCCSGWGAGCERMLQLKMKRFTSQKQRALWATQFSSSSSSIRGSFSVISPHHPAQRLGRLHPISYCCERKTIFGWVIRYRARLNQHAASRLITGPCGSLITFFISVCWTWIMK